MLLTHNYNQFTKFLRTQIEEKVLEMKIILKLNKLILKKNPDDLCVLFAMSHQASEVTLPVAG